MTALDMKKDDLCTILPENLVNAALSDVYALFTERESSIREKARIIHNRCRNDPQMVYIKGGEIISIRSDTNEADKIVDNNPDCIVGTYSKGYSIDKILKDILYTLGR